MNAGLLRSTWSLCMWSTHSDSTEAEPVDKSNEIHSLSSLAFIPRVKPNEDLSQLAGLKMLDLLLLAGKAPCGRCADDPS